MSNIIRLGASNGSPRIFLAIPSYGPVHPQFAHALMATDRECADAGISVDMEIIHGHCHVDDCRNLLVRDFLESEADKLVFIDADMSWRPRDLIRLVQYDRDVVAGVYPYKSDTLDFPCRLLPGEIWSDKDGLIEVDGVPGGFLCVSRKALDSLEDAAETYLNDPGEMDRRRVPIIFERTLEKGVRYSGDYSFCRKWRALGGKIYIDPTFRFGHFGDKEWKGCFGDFLKSKAGLGFEKLALIKAGKEDDDTIIDLFDEWGNHFAGGPEFQEAAMALVRQTEGPILEFGSGLSTLIMAAANPRVQIHCLENDQGWASKLNEVLSLRGLKNAHVHVRPMVRYQEGLWYDVSDVPKQSYSLVIIDGPARQKGERWVWQSVMGMFCQNAIWLMDDADDPGQLRELRKHDREIYLMGEQRKFAIAVPKALKEAA